MKKAIVKPQNKPKEGELTIKEQEESLKWLDKVIKNGVVIDMENKCLN